MKTVGIIGGIGPDSTVDYYKSIIEVYRAQKGDDSAPSIIINSLDVSKIIRLVTANRWNELAEYIGVELQRLERAGADFALLAANTPHIVFDELQKKTTLPLLSIIETACEFAISKGFNKLGLFGTRFTMEGEFYASVFRRRQITLIIPDEKEREYIHRIYMDELLKGKFLPETRQQLLSIADRMIENEQIQGLLLAGTELPLILGDAPATRIPFLDTTQIHVRAIVDRLLNE